METTIDIDTGGTFTDGTVRRGGEVMSLKTETTPHDLTVCFSDIIKQAADENDQSLREFLTEVDCVRYSTTIATNAIIERDGANVGVLAQEEGLKQIVDENTSLVRDILDDGAQAQIETSTDSEKISRQYTKLTEELADNIVIGMDSLSGERAVHEVLLDEQPEHFLGSVPAHLSWEVSDDPDDKRRLLTTVIDAYLHPKLGDFLYKAEDFLRENGYNKSLLVFCNDGSSSRVAKTTALNTYNSGPSAGVQGVAELADLYDVENAVALDIGGTSADVALVDSGTIQEEPFGNIDDLEVSFPMRELFPLGGGGGTIAHVEDETLELGPESAGANPGPACYGLGGTRPTVTDANVVAGILSPNVFAGDELSLDADRAERAIRTHVAEPLDISVDAAAYRILERMESHIGSQINRILTDNGINPAEATLIAYGGSGPTHAAGVAGHAGVDEIIVPSEAAVFSAYSVGFSDVVHDYHIRGGSHGDFESLDAKIERIDRRARRDIEGEGFDPENVSFCWSVHGISDDETDNLGTVDASELEGAALDNVDQYDQIDLKLTARASLPTHEFVKQEASDVGFDPVETIDVRWSSGPDSQVEPTPVFDVRDVSGHYSGEGPAILRKTDTTYAIPPKWHCQKDEFNNVVINKMEES